MPKKVEWKSAPEAKDYDGVSEFLTLLCPEKEAAGLVDLFRKADRIERAGKDLLRAAALPLLGEDDPHVRTDLKRIQKGKPLPPVLLIRGNLRAAHPLVIADGYHRICASYAVDESSPVFCRMISL